MANMAVKGFCTYSKKDSRQRNLKSDQANKVKKKSAKKWT